MAEAVNDTESSTKMHIINVPKNGVSVIEALKIIDAIAENHEQELPPLRGIPDQKKDFSLEMAESSRNSESSVDNRFSEIEARDEVMTQIKIKQKSTDSFLDFDEENQERVNKQAIQANTGLLAGLLAGFAIQSNNSPAMPMTFQLEVFAIANLLGFLASFASLKLGKRKGMISKLLCRFGCSATAVGVIFLIYHFFPTVTILVPVLTCFFALFLFNL